MIPRICFLLSCLFFSSVTLSADKTDISDRIRQRVERIRASGDVVIAGQPIASQLVLPALYERRGYAPVWTRADSVAQLFAALENIADDGPALKPGMQDARVAQLRQRLAASGDMPGHDLLSTQFNADVEASKPLFGRTARAFSSGCIRVENPFRFGELLLNDPQWDKEKIQAVVAGGKTTRVSLKQPVTVILLYWTVSTDEAGNVVFRKDIYNRDAPVLEGLRQPFHFRKSPVLKP